MTKLTVSQMSTNPSKEEEIHTLHEIYKLLPAGSYLASLISLRLIEWTEFKIKGDINPDIYEYYTASSERENALNHEINTLKREYEEKISAMANELKNANEFLLDKKAKLTFWTDRADDLQEELETKENELACAQAEILIEKSNVMRLKIEVYDLTHSKTGGVK